MGASVPRLTTSSRFGLQPAFGRLPYASTPRCWGCQCHDVHSRGRLPEATMGSLRGAREVGPFRAALAGLASGLPPSSLSTADAHRTPTGIFANTTRTHQTVIVFNYMQTHLAEIDWILLHVRIEWSNERGQRGLNLCDKSSTGYAEPSEEPQRQCTNGAEGLPSNFGSPTLSQPNDCYWIPPYSDKTLTLSQLYL